MANPTVGMLHTFDFDTGIIVDMDESIYMISPDDDPMISGRAADGLSVLSSQGTTQVKVEWMTDELLLPKSQLSAAAVTADAYIVVQSGHQNRFSTGTLLMLGKNKEKVHVTGYGTTADSLLVTRGYGSTDATTHASADDVINLGTVLVEGSDPENGRYRDRDPFYNVAQIFGPEEIKLSATKQIVRQYGVPNEMARQIYHRTLEIVIQRNQAILYGLRNDDGAGIRSMGGLTDYITTANGAVIDSTSTQLTVAGIQSMLARQYNNGRVGDRLVANPLQLGDLNDIGNTSIVRTDLDDARRGRQRVMAVETEYGTLPIARNRHVRNWSAFLIRRDGVTRRPLRPLVFERLAKTGDSDKGQLVCEESLEVKGVAHMGAFTNLSYS